MLKFSKILAFTVIGLFLLILMTIEGIHLYGLKDMPNDTSPTKANYSKIYHKFLWADLIRTPEIKQEPTSPLLFTFSLTKALIFSTNINDINQVSRGLQIAFLNSRLGLLHSQTHPDTQISQLSKAIWITQHWTVDQSINNLLAHSYFGRNCYGIETAAHAYFGKTHAALNRYEIALLISIQKGPVAFDPWLRTERSISRMNSVIENTKSLWPKEFKNLKKQKQLPEGLLSEHLVNGCTE